MFAQDNSLESAHSFSRFDPESPFSTVSAHPIALEDCEWPSVEHYYQAKKFAKPSVVDDILKTDSGYAAYKLGNRWWKWGKAKHWQRNRRLMMTRALYTKLQSHQEVRDALMATGDEKIIETSLYNPYWGIGRDQRGENMLGQIWMDIRARVRAEIKAQAAGNPVASVVPLRTVEN